MFPQKPCLETQGKVGGKPQGFIASMEGSPYAWFHSPFKPNKEAGSTHCLQKKTRWLYKSIYLYMFLVGSCWFIQQWSPSTSLSVEFPSIAKESANPPLHWGGGKRHRQTTTPGRRMGVPNFQSHRFFLDPKFWDHCLYIHIRSLKSWCLEIWCKVTFGGGVQELWSNLSAKNYNRIGTLKKCYFRDSRVEFLAWNQHKPTKPPFTVEASGSWNV